MGQVPANTAIEVIHVGSLHGTEVQNRIRAINLTLKQSYTDLAGWWKDRILFDMNHIMSFNVMWHTLKIREHLVSGFTPYEVIPIGGIPGRQGGASGPLQVAGVMTSRVKYFGMLRDGRTYYPAIPYSVYVNGQWDAGYLSNVNQLRNTLNTKYSLTGNDLHFKWAIYGKLNANTWGYAVVERFDWQSQPGVIRRRRKETV